MGARFVPACPLRDCSVVLRGAPNRFRAAPWCSVVLRGAPAILPYTYLQSLLRRDGMGRAEARRPLPGAALLCGHAPEKGTLVKITPQARAEILEALHESLSLIETQARNLANIRTLHSPDRIGAEQICRECLKPWPCPTAHATVE